VPQKNKLSWRLGIRFENRAIKHFSMKNLILAFSVLTAFFFSANAQEAGPKITWDATVVDYGNVKQGADGVREFSFTNTGNAPLVINSATGSCGCTVPSFSKEPIMPGQKGSIKVQYDTNRVGPINKSVTVVSNAPNGTDVLRIKGNVEGAATPE
jgi:hypothetical protein